MKIGIITVPKFTHYERISIDNRPWLKKLEIPSKNRFKNNSVTKDFAVLNYLKHKKWILLE